MIDPLAEVVALLRPGAGHSKVVSAAGPWRVHRMQTGQPFYCVVLDGSCRLAVDGQQPITLHESDFVLIPAAYNYTNSSIVPPPPDAIDEPAMLLPSGEYRRGIQSGPPDVRLLIGHCVFGSPDSALLVSLLPQVVHVRGEKRLTTIVQLVRDESRELRPAREEILSRLLEVLLIETLRSSAGTVATSGLVRGLADVRIATAIRRIHENPANAWTIVELAKEAALSRSAFFERFSRTVGMAPMEYLLAWRMALAKNLLQRKEIRITEVAERVGYNSASSFSVAFTRYVGLPPSRYLNEVIGAAKPIARST